MAERQPLTKEEIVERVGKAGINSKAWILYDPTVLVSVSIGNYRKAEWRAERLEQKEREMIRRLPRRPLIDIGR